MVSAGLCLAAFLTAGLSGMTGLGGGTILVAVLFATGLPPAELLPLHALVQLVSNGSRTVAYAGSVHWSSLLVFLITAVPAPFLVAPLVVDADPDRIRIVLGIFLILMTWPKWLGWIRPGGRGAMAAAGLVAGGLGTVVGATGAIIAPFFLGRDWSAPAVIGTKAVCQAAAHIVKLVAFAGVGIGVGASLELAIAMSVCVVAGTWVGKQFLNRLPVERFRIIYRLILLILGSRLLLSALM